jgi:hypothetical protein
VGNAGGHDEMEEDDIDAAFYGSASEYGDDFEMADPEQIM